MREVTADQLQADLDRLGSYAAVAREYGTPVTTLKKHGIRLGTQSPHVRATSMRTAGSQQSRAVAAEPDATIYGDTATITLPAGTPWTLDAIRETTGLAADEWIPVRALPNVWQGLAPEGVIVDLHQLKIEMVRRVPADTILPARTEGWKPKRHSKPRKQTTPELVCIVSDTHAPYHDPGLHDCLLQWLERHKPARAYDFGDLLDLPTPSRHRTTKGFEASPQESINARYKLDAERVAASPDTAWAAAYGNHDERLSHAAQDKIGTHVARLARANDTLPVWDLGYLLRYDELGIEVVRPSGDYHSVTIEIAPGLFGRHGTKAGKHGGAVKAIERRASSIAQGHDHKQIHQQVIKYDDCGIARKHWTISFGAMCQRDLGYVEDADTAQGFTTIVVHPDGSWHPEMASYDDASQVLTWRDERYQPR